MTTTIDKSSTKPIFVTSFSKKDKDSIAQHILWEKTEYCWIPSVIRIASKSIRLVKQLGTPILSNKLFILSQLADLNLYLTPNGIKAHHLLEKKTFRGSFNTGSVVKTASGNQAVVPLGHDKENSILNDPLQYLSYRVYKENLIWIMMNFGNKTSFCIFHPAEQTPMHTSGTLIKWSSLLHFLKPHHRDHSLLITYLQTHLLQTFSRTNSDFQETAHRSMDYFRSGAKLPDGRCEYSYH